MARQIRHDNDDLPDDHELVDDLNNILDHIDHQLADDHLVYVNHPDLDDHLDHLIDHPYDNHYLYDPIHHFIVAKHNDDVVAKQFNDDCRPFLIDDDAP